MSNVARNIATVNEIYAAFGRKDVPAILERLAEDVEWEFGAMDHGVPWLTPGRGRGHALKFFQTLGTLDFRHFAVRAVMGDGDLVVGLVELEAFNPVSGKTVRETLEAHVWRFDAAGRITGMRHCADTHQHWLAR